MIMLRTDLWALAIFRTSGEQDLDATPLEQGTASFALLGGSHLQRFADGLADCGWQPHRDLVARRQVGCLSMLQHPSVVSMCSPKDFPGQANQVFAKLGCLGAFAELYSLIPQADCLAARYKQEGQALQARLRVEEGKQAELQATKDRQVTSSTVTMSP